MGVSMTNRLPQSARIIKQGGKMGKNQRGKRDGTGPYKGSAQAGNVGKRRMSGQKCPKKGK